MKLSSRKQLLEEADEVLRQISESDPPFDFRYHKSLFKGSPSKVDIKSKQRLEFLQWKFERDLYRIKKKYRGEVDSESAKKEVEELTQLIDRLRKHLSRENFQEIPEDPKQQTELQKMIVNTPRWSIGMDPEITFIKDPKTGMYWSSVTGVPDLPYKLEKEVGEWVRAKDTEYIAHVWDYKRGWFYNVVMGVIKQIFGPTGGGAL